MNSIHDAIEARWAETAALVALVPLKNLGVGKFPAERADAITYPYVSREIQSEPKLYISSDGEARRSTVMFRIWSPRHEDGMIVRNAFRGERGDPDGFHNKAFIAGGRRVLLCREEDWQEFQEPDGMWSFMMPVAFDHTEPPVEPTPDPDPDPSEDDEEIMFAQTQTVSVASTTVESSLIGTGQGDATIPAGDMEVGEEWVAELSGDWTLTGSASDMTFRVYLGGVEIVEFDLAMLFGGDAVPWYARIRVTRLTTGVAGTVRVEGEFVSVGTDANPRTFHDAAAITIPDNVSIAPGVTAQWAAAHANNRFRMMPPSSFRVRRMVTV